MQKVTTDSIQVLIDIKSGKKIVLVMIFVPCMSLAEVTRRRNIPSVLPSVKSMHQNIEDCNEYDELIQE